MDVNGTRFHLLLGESDWSPPRVVVLGGVEPPPAGYDTDRQDLSLRPEPYRFASDSAQPPLQLSARRGAAADRYGNWYWIDQPGTGVLVRSAGDGRTTPFWPVADPVRVGEPGAPMLTGAPGGPFRPGEPAVADAPDRLAGLAVTADHHLVVGVAPDGPHAGGLLVFDLQAGGPPERWRWPDGVPFSPHDLAARPGGGVVVLDREHRALWELDRRLLVIPHRGSDPTRPAPAFTPAPGAVDPATPCAGPPVAADAVDLAAPAPPATPDPVAVDVAADGTVLVLLAGPPAAGPRPSGPPPSGLLALRDGVPAGTAELSTGAYDLAWAADPDRVLVVDDRGDQAREWRLGRTGETLTATEPVPPRYHPMRLFGGRALVTAGGSVHYDVGAADAVTRFVPLAEQSLVRYPTEAVIETDVLDGDEPGCVWHRFLADGCFPSESALQVWTATGEDAGVLRRAPEWRAEPDPRPRDGGPELPFVELGERLGTVETLLQNARGRYLRLRLRLSGNGRTTPRLRAVRVWFPRFSYAEHYLPAAYREEPGPASFLDRFLANPEGILTALEDRIAAAHGLLDPRIAPDDALDWLASWYDLALDPAWDAPRRRLLLRHAARFFACRGTVRGLHAALALVFDPCAGPEIFDPAAAEGRGVRVVELYRTRTGASPVWSPGDGAAALHRLWAAAVATGPFPLSPPPDAAAWTAFARQVLGFVPEAGATATALWQDFLARRYGSAAAARAAHGLPADPDATIDLPAAVPDREPALTDWHQLQSQVLPAHRSAHRFRVLLPVPVSARPGSPSTSVDERSRRLALARRVVELEKPAHTVFDVRYYWDAFRIGAARLGLDTIADLGGRSPDLLIDAVLGASHLGAQRLADPMDATAATRPPLLPAGRVSAPPTGGAS